jgi:hypothetical protein
MDRTASKALVERKARSDLLGRSSAFDAHRSAPRATSAAQDPAAHLALTVSRAPEEKPVLPATPGQSGLWEWSADQALAVQGEPLGALGLRVLLAFLGHRVRLDIAAQ